MSSTACWIWDARTPSASPEPRSGLGSTRPSRRPMQQRRERRSDINHLELGLPAAGSLPGGRELIDAHEQWKASIGRSAIASMPIALWTLSGFLERPRSPMLISLWTLSGWCCPARGHPWLPDMPDSALCSANPGVPAPLRGPKMHDLADHSPWGRQDALRVRIPGIWMSFGVTGGRDGLIRSPAAPASTRASG